jgi:hypothetical protein
MIEKNGVGEGWQSGRSTQLWVLILDGDVIG